MSPRAPREPVYLLLDEAAEYARASIATVRYWINTGKLTGYKPGRRVLVRRVDLVTLIESAAMGGAP